MPITGNNMRVSS